MPTKPKPFKEHTAWAIVDRAGNICALWREPELFWKKDVAERRLIQQWNVVDEYYIQRVRIVSAEKK